SNLLSNAIKFTERGSVSLLLSTIDRQAGTATLSLIVKDTGIGIAPDIQARLFSPFVQADTSTTRRFGGTGLGLPIVKRLAAFMGGDVKLTSALGAGSEFALTLPFVVEADALAGDSGSRPISVLVIAQAGEERQAMSSMSRALGWSVESLESGPQALT